MGREGGRGVAVWAVRAVRWRRVRDIESGSRQHKMWAVRFGAMLEQPFNSTSITQWKAGVRAGGPDQCVEIVGKQWVFN